MILPLKKIVYGEYVRSWCKLPYPRHPKGCPMFGMRSDCPPEAPFLDRIAEAPFHLVIGEIDLEAQEKRMRERHPDWTSRMCRNPRYWQAGLMRKILREAQGFLWTFPEGIILGRPEANGVNLFSTCRLHGIRLEVNPQKIIMKMVLVGRRKNEKAF